MMKKYLILMIGMLFVFGFSASAFAIHAENPEVDYQATTVVAKGATVITLGGELRERGRYQKNLSLNNDTKKDDFAFYDSRLRFNVDAKLKNVEAFFEVQYSNENEVWGGQLAGNASTTNVPVTITSPSGTIVGTGTVPVTSIAVNQGDLSKATGLFGEGNRLLSRNFSGIRQAWIMYKFDLGVPAGIKVGHQLLSLSQGQFFDHTKWGDDAIVFFMDPTKDLHVGLLTIKFDEGATNLAANDDIDAYVGLFVLKLGSAGNVGGNLTYVRASKDASIRLAGTEIPQIGNKFNFYNLGIHGSNTIGPVGLNWEGDYQFGKVDLLDADFKGYGAMVDANIKAGPATIVFGGAYGSGGTSGDTDIKTFVTSLGLDPHYTFVYEYLVPSSLGVTGSGIANTTYLKGGAKFAPTNDISLGADLYWLRASKTNSGVSKDIGWEADAMLTWKLAQNLAYVVRGGYLWAGDFYKDTVGKDDAAYAVDHFLLVNF